MYYHGLLPIDVTCTEKLSPIAVFQMKYGNELGYDTAFSYFPWQKLHEVHMTN